MGSLSKFRARAGLGHQTAVGTPSTPDIWFGYESASHDGAGVNSLAELGMAREPILAVNYGMQHSWAMSGIQTNITAAAYIMWLAMGSQSQGAGPPYTHTILIDSTGESEYITVNFDRGTNLVGANTPTLRLEDSKMSNFSFECQMNSFAKIACGGLGCRTTETTALTAAILSGANNAPMSAASFTAAVTTGAYTKLKYGAGALADDAAITGFKVEFTQGMDYGGTTFGQKQPDRVNEGPARIRWTVEREFFGAGATAFYDAWKNGTKVGAEFKAVVGAHSLILRSLNMAPAQGLGGEVGNTGDPVKMQLVCDAYASSPDLSLEVIAVDSTDWAGFAP